MLDWGFDFKPPLCRCWDFFSCSVCWFHSRRPFFRGVAIRMFCVTIYCRRLLLPGLRFGWRSMTDGSPPSFCVLCAGDGGAAAAETQNNECVCVSESERGKKILTAYTHSHTHTHTRLNRNMEVYTWMMSDSPASLLFLPSLWVFPHSAGRSWVFLQANAGHWNCHSSNRHIHKNVHSNRKVVVSLQCRLHILVSLLWPSPLAENQSL